MQYIGKPVTRRARGTHISRIFSIPITVISQSLKTPCSPNKDIIALRLVRQLMFLDRFCPPGEVPPQIQLPVPTVVGGRGRGTCLYLWGIWVCFYVIEAGVFGGGLRVMSGRTCEWDARGDEERGVPASAFMLPCLRSLNVGGK